MRDWKTRVKELETQHALLAQKVASERAFLKQANRELQNVATARNIAKTIARQIEEQVHGKIAGVVTRCLVAVFEEPYEFELRFEEKRGRTEARPIFLKDGHELDDPLEEVGGGVVDVAAFAARLACLVLTRPPGRRLVVLDEPFRFLKPPEVFGPRICSLLETLSEELGVQFLQVTNIPEFQCGKVIEL